MHDAYPDPTLPPADTQSQRRGAFPQTRTNNRPDTWHTVNGRGRRKGATSGPPRMTQTRLDDYRTHPVNTPVAGPSRVSAVPTPVASTPAPSMAPTNTVDADTATATLLTQDFNDLIQSSTNFFAPLTPEDLDDDPPQWTTRLTVILYRTLRPHLSPLALSSPPLPASLALDPRCPATPGISPTSLPLADGMIPPLLRPPAL